MVAEALQRVVEDGGLVLAGERAVAAEAAPQQAQRRTQSERLHVREATDGRAAEGAEQPPQRGRRPLRQPHREAGLQQHRTLRGTAGLAQRYIFDRVAEKAGEAQGFDVGRYAFQRAPGIAESVEWAKALVALDTLVVDPEVVADTAGLLFKQREDLDMLAPALVAEFLRPPEAGQ